MPERKRFNEEIQERIDAFGKTLIADIPELDGVGIALTYAPNVGEPEPQSYAYSRTGDPRHVCRMAIQSLKLLGIHINNIAAAMQQIASSMPPEEENAEEADARTDGSDEEEEDSTSAPPSAD